MIKNHWFWKYCIGKNKIFDNLEAINLNIFICSKVYYCLLFTILIPNIYNIDIFIASPMTHPEWSVFWTRLLPDFPWQIFLLVICFLSNTITIAFTEQKKYRVINFISFFLLFSALNSYPKINHNLHTALIPLFFLCLIDFNPQKKIQNTVIYTSAIGSLLITYSLSGLWKILAALKHLIKGDKGSFDLNGMTRYIDYNFIYSEPNLIAKWLIENELIGFLFLWVGILLEFFSIFILFFPKVHRIWGVGLILMHIGIANVLDVHFSYVCVSIVPLLLLSPFKSNFSKI